MCYRNANTYNRSLHIRIGPKVGIDFIPCFSLYPIVSIWYILP